MMPKGRKIDRGYATVTEEDGIDYRTIAKIMTDDGDKMNHASARNYLMRAMRKIAVDVCRQQGYRFDDQKIDSIASSPLFQSAVSDLLQVFSTNA